MNKITTVFSPIFIMVVSVCIFSCGSDQDGPAGDPLGEVTGFSDCKDFESTVETGMHFSSIPSTQACIEYAYDGAGTLTMKHINAGFNCCPGKIYADMTITDDTITINEYEREAGCHCDCLFDVDMKIYNLPAGTYRLEIFEPYLHPDNDPFNFVITVSPGIHDRYCLDRSGYPWGL